MRALAVETHENWLEGTRYLNMQHLTEHKKEALRMAFDALMGLAVSPGGRRRSGGAAPLTQLT